MINKGNFKRIQEDLKRFETEREQRLKDSRDVIKLSKQIVFSIHRDDLRKASSYVKQRNNRLPSKSELKVDSECYLMGLSDLTGELVRRAANEIINKDLDSAFKIRKFVNDLYGEFIQLDIRNGDLRRKADAVRWNLKKLEDVIFDVKVKGR